MVKHPENVEGDIWLFLQQENTKFYPTPLALYPSNCQVTLAPAAGTEFDILIYFGGEQDHNKRFKLFVTVADQEASSFLTETLKSWCQANNYPGLDKLPDGVMVKHRVDVRRSGAQ
jgi:hypothetical protein